MYCFSSVCQWDAGAAVIDKFLRDHENNALFSVFDSPPKWHFSVL